MGKANSTIDLTVQVSTRCLKPSSVSSCSRSSSSSSIKTSWCNSGSQRKLRLADSSLLQIRCLTRTQTLFSKQPAHRFNRIPMSSWGRCRRRQPSEINTRSSNLLASSQYSTNRTKCSSSLSSKYSRRQLLICHNNCKALKLSMTTRIIVLRGKILSTT